MFSHRLPYYAHATHAHLQAQDECTHKDAAIAQLRGELTGRRQQDADFEGLNEQIYQLEGRYGLLLAERERGSRDIKGKSDNDRKAILQLRGEQDDLKVHLQRHNQQIEDLLKDNTSLQKQIDGRQSEISSIKYQIKQTENRNARSNDENRALVISIKGMKEERKRLEEDCENESERLDGSMATIKKVEKDVRSVEADNVKLEKTLHQADADRNKLVGEHRDVQDDHKRADNRLKHINNSSAELQITRKNLQQQTAKAHAEFDRNSTQLNQQIERGRDILAKITGVEAAIKCEEAQLDRVIAEEEQLRKEHFKALDKNKHLNMQIDQMLSLIAEYEIVNQDLLNEIDSFISQDERARTMLNRQAMMREVVESTIRQISLTEEPIRHLKC